MYKKNVLFCLFRLQRPKPESELSAGNSSEDLMANDLSENEIVGEDDANTEWTV